MKKGRDGLNNVVNIEAVNTLGEEGVDVATLMNRDLRSGQSKVSASPALLERCE